jgi:hypothetical protein
MTEYKRDIEQHGQASSVLNARQQPNTGHLGADTLRSQVLRQCQVLRTQCTGASVQSTRAGDARAPCTRSCGAFDPCSWEPSSHPTSQLGRKDKTASGRRPGDRAMQQLHHVVGWRVPQAEHCTCRSSQSLFLHAATSISVATAAGLTHHASGPARPCNFRPDKWRLPRLAGWLHQHNNPHTGLTNHLTHEALRTARAWAMRKASCIRGRCEQQKLQGAGPPRCSMAALVSTML